ncbi:hydroxymethylglutaryl-CoA reductase, degradative [Lentilactobacillus otakiensis]|nr:hydroxymethylglutaryl-CoA reductase, degradative [Lentilactobacillus otakiensis]KRL11845.1 hydroxymethylglutaryl-CoA reductase [Lentilactobacillus otakiensis DSM 19908 = JCM 15040]MDV3519185.1 hydroxymethylglutaryl-CoA reductase, degradative [Lentilactobacillus otakiensis]
MMENKWDHFYKKGYAQRLQLIADSVGLSDAQLQLIHQNEDHASGELVENNLTSYPLPEGVVTGLIVNGRRHLVPMVTEEPSVIAAASNGAKLLSAGEGIHCAIPEKLVSGQVIVKHAEIKAVSKFVETNRQQILNIANQSHPSILKYGRGAQKVAVRELSPTFLSIDLSVDTGEAMGANIINTMLEAISNWLSDQLHVETTMAILSNFADEEVVEVTGQVAVDKLASRSLDGRQVAQRIADASEVAQLDVKRATTHNKGIMNGVDAAVIAFGNDWRAVESAAHAFAARQGPYKGLSTWQVVGDQLVGKMALPVPIGFVGGASKVLPLVAVNQQIAQIHHSQDEMQVIAAVGLAQNLAALKALVTDGIQKGHMALQLKSLALSNGATTQELPAVLAQLRQIANPNSQTVKEILKTIRR